MPIIVKIEDVYNLHIAWKYADASTGLFSDSPRHAVNRISFGAIKDIKYDERIKEGEVEVSSYLCCSSQRNSEKYVAFKFCEMLGSIWKPNAYTLEIQKMKSNGRNKLLAIYLQLLIKSEFFSLHEPHSHLADGRRIDGTELQEPDILKNGGTIGELQQFIQKAKISAEDIDNIEKVPLKLSGKPKLLGSEPEPTAKKGEY